MPTSSSEKLLRIVGLIALALLTATARAEQPTEDQPQERWYDIELVVFARTAASAGAGEHWPDEPGGPDLDNALPLSRLMVDPALPLAENAFRILAADQRQLGGIYRGINNAAGMEPLMYAAWRQPVMEPEQSVSVYLTTAAEAGELAALEGNITMSVRRYLHLHTDLLLRGGDSIYRMQAHRRMRSGELHYLDHPVLGILVEARPVELPPAPEEEILPEPLAVDAPNVSDTDQPVPPSGDTDR